MHLVAAQNGTGKEVALDYSKDEIFIVTKTGTEEQIEFLNNLFRRAHQDGFADIHFRKTPSKCVIRMRVPNGKLIHIDAVSPDWMILFDDKIRSKSKISLTENRAALDGRMTFSVGGEVLDIRVSRIPNVNDGFQIVCRIQNRSNSLKRLDDLELPLAARDTFKSIIREPHGLLLITGPTGSGKTTTLYSILNELDDGERNIITIENPVEYTNDNFSQINVDERDMTFASALRGVLRQDPDVIMVGEIRDRETAEIAVQAALTGHLVLSTLHANTAPTAYVRLIDDFGIDPGKLGAALRMVIAQRLLRTFKPDAAIKRRPPNDMERAWLRAYRIPSEGKEYPEAGNPLEDYHGYVPIMEIIVADPRVKKAMTAGEVAIANAASRQHQYESLGSAAELLAVEGRIPLTEAIALASAHDAPGITNKRIGELLVDAGKITKQQMRDVLDKQLIMRSENPENHIPLGKLMIQEGLCTKEEIVFYIGFTSDAYDIVLERCVSPEQKDKLQEIVAQWAPGVTSLFKLAFEAELIKEGDLNHVHEL